MLELEKLAQPVEEDDEDLFGDDEELPVIVNQNEMGLESLSAEEEDDEE
jgi:hypothetical protein